MLWGATVFLIVISTRFSKVGIQKKERGNGNEIYPGGTFKALGFTVLFLFFFVFKKKKGIMGFQPPTGF